MLRGLWRAEPVVICGGLLLVVWPIWAERLPGQWWNLTRLVVGLVVVLVARATVYVWPSVRDLTAAAVHRGDSVG